MSKRLKKLVEIAYKEAIKSIGAHQHGAVIIGNGGKILAKACNYYGNGYHAEMRALCRIPHDAKKGAKAILVVRTRKSQRFGLSKPCKRCEKTLFAFGI